MATKTILIILISFCSINVKSQNVNLHDSVCVKNFIECYSINEKITFVQKNLKPFVQLIGYTDLILWDIAKVTKTEIVINSINGHMKVPFDRLMIELNEQMEAIKLKLSGCCTPNQQPSGASLP